MQQNYITNNSPENNPTDTKFQTGYQFALQQDEEDCVRDLGLLSGDLKERSLIRQQKGTPLVSKGDVFYITKQVKMIAERHFELLYGKKWLSQPKELKDKIASNATANLIQEIINSPDPSVAFEISQTFIGAILQTELNNVLPNF